jgi:hypothetical protein
LADLRTLRALEFGAHPSVLSAAHTAIIPVTARFGALPLLNAE